MDNQVKTTSELIKMVEKGGKDLIKEENNISEKEKQAIKNGK